MWQEHKAEYVRKEQVFLSQILISTEGKTPDSIEAMAKDTVAFIRALGFDQVDLLGFSMGGAIAQEVAIRYPERIDRLILFGTFCGGIWSEPPAHTWRFHHAFRIDPADPRGHRA